MKKVFYGNPTTCLRCGKLHKADSTHVEKFVSKHSSAIRTLVHTQLQKVAKDVAKQLTAKLTKVDEDVLQEIEDLLDQLDLDGMAKLAGTLTDTLKSLFREAEDEGLVLAGIEESVGMAKQLDVRALEWSRNRSAELVGRRVLDDGSVIDNPNALYSILETTRDLLRTTVADAVEAGFGTKELTNSILESFAFSESRAEMISRTELANAMTEGNVAAWRESGQVTTKRSLLGNNENHGQDDIDNSEEGWIDFEDDFQSGDFGPPYHPNCVCALQPGVSDEEDQPDEDAEDMEMSAKVSLAKLLKGDVDGHEFHGNQYTEGTGGGEVDKDGNPAEGTGLVANSIPQVSKESVETGMNLMVSEVTEAYGKEQEIDPKDVVSTQKTLVSSRMDEYRDNPDTESKTGAGSIKAGNIPTVMKTDGKLVVVDGNHRIAAALERGEKITVKLVDTDKALAAAKEMFDSAKEKGYLGARAKFTPALQSSYAISQARAVIRERSEKIDLGQLIKEQ